MAKAPSEGASGSQPARPASTRRRNLLVAGALAIIVAAGALYGWQWWRERSGFAALVEAGQSALSRVESEPSRGQDHLGAGETFDYGDPFPLSGPHANTWTPPGVYAQPQPAIRNVHALEHGNIVAYVDRPGDAAMALLADWAGQYIGQWDGLVVQPAPSLADAVVLTAWTRRLRLERWDAAAAAAFIDAYRGRGPEFPVR